ncbi:MAG: DUF3568 family protein [Nitrospinota bacterium]
MLRKIITLLMIPVLFVITSCAAPLVPLAAGAGAGAGGYAWYKGELVKNFEKPMGAVYAASLNAVKSMGLSVNKKAKGPFEAKVETMLAGGKNVNIRIKKLSSKSSEVAIRVGVIGNENKTNHIMRQIEKRLAGKR